MSHGGATGYLGQNDPRPSAYGRSWFTYLSVFEIRTNNNNCWISPQPYPHLPHLPTATLLLPAATSPCPPLIHCPAICGSRSPSAVPPLLGSLPPTTARDAATVACCCYTAACCYCCVITAYYYCDVERCS